MKDLKPYIDESLFANEVPDVAKTENQLALEAFYKCARDDWDEPLKNSRLLNKIKIEVKSDGLYITFDSSISDRYIIIKIIDKSAFLNIKYFSGSLAIRHSDIKDLKNIFAPNCEFRGQLWIQDCDIKDLEGAPAKILHKKHSRSYFGLHLFQCKELKSLKGLPEGLNNDNVIVQHCGINDEDVVKEIKKYSK